MVPGSIKSLLEERSTHYFTKLAPWSSLAFQTQKNQHTLPSTQGHIGVGKHLSRVTSGTLQGVRCPALARTREHLCRCCDKQCVAGGGSGIGRALCQLLARDGARVLVTDLNLKGAQETLKLMPGSGHHLALQMDVTQRGAVEAAIAAAREEFGAPPSLLVNSAGVSESRPFGEVTEGTLSAIIEVNLKGTFLVTQAVTNALLERRQEPEEEIGAVVNISSLAGKTGTRGLSHYVATKGAVIALTKSCAAELAGKGVRVNCVLPGAIDTPMTQHISKESLQAYIKRNPLGRTGRPEEVAEVVVFLLSRRSSYIVGASVEVSGGIGM